MEAEDNNIESQEMKLKLDLIRSNLTATLASPKTAKPEKKTGKSKSNVTEIKNKKKEKNKSPKKKKPSKKTQQESEDVGAETDITTRRWDDTKGRTLSKGKFTPEEERLILDSLCEYALGNNLDEENMLKLITEKQTKGDSSIWTKVAENLPNRSVQSIHNFCHRKLNPYNYKGEWTQEEIKNLVTLYEEHGAKWELIGKELERTATNVKDKFKQIGGKNHKLRKPEFNLISCLKLIKYVQKYLSDPENEGQYQILKCDYKFKNNIDSKRGVCFVLDETKNKFLIDSSVKESESRIIIRNLLKLIINCDVLEKIIEDRAEISWNYVSGKFAQFSAVDCKNSWDKILREFDLYERSQIRKDLKMIKQLVNCDYENIDDVNFEIIRNKRTPEENKNKLTEIIKMNDIYSVKSLNDVLSSVQIGLEKNLKTVKNEDKEFQDELRTNHPVNFSKVLKEFLSSKRERK